jgi:hypothetical protein
MVGLGQSVLPAAAALLGLLSAGRVSSHARLLRNTRDLPFAPPGARSRALQETG